jgi:hypothetical protein
MTSPLCRARAICPGEGVVLDQDLLCALVLVLGLTLAQATGATATTMWFKMTAGRIHPSSAGVCVCVCVSDLQ